MTLQLPEPGLLFSLLFSSPGGCPGNIVARTLALWPVGGFSQQALPPVRWRQEERNSSLFVFTTSSCVILILMVLLFFFGDSWFGVAAFHGFSSQPGSGHSLSSLVPSGLRWQSLLVLLVKAWGLQYLLLVPSILYTSLQMTL